MKKVLRGIFVLPFLVSTVLSFASENPVKLLRSDASSTILQFTLPSYTLKPVETPWGQQHIVTAPGAAPILKAGFPDLPLYSASIIIDDFSTTTLEIISSTSTLLEDVDIAPSKGNLYRNLNPDQVSFSRSEIYTSSAIWPSSAVDSREPYVLRDYRGQVILFYPFQYDPQNRTLRIFSEITVRVQSDNNREGINQKLPHIRPRTDGEFQSIYQRQFLNYESKISQQKSNYPVIGEQGKMLVISHEPFMPAMQPFIEWKRQRGLEIEIVDVATIGLSDTAIKAFVQQHYDSSSIKYLLLVGDHAQVPAGATSYGPSDFFYGYLDGSDSYPEIFVGRFSAEMVSQVMTQVQRSIDYEKNVAVGAASYGKAIGIGSQEGPGDDNELDYEHIRNIGDKLLNYSYDYTHELFEGSQGGNDAAGNPNAGQLATAINDGAGLINYTGHGSEFSSTTTGFTNGHIMNLDNAGKLPFFWSVACSNGDFLNNTCYAERWLRSTKNDEPIGAVATLMSTILQSWSPPMDAQDEMVDILTESITSNIKRTFGGLSVHGCMKMNDDYGVAGFEMTDTWVVFGDPSLVVRSAPPGLLSVVHPSHRPLGTSSLTLNCNTENALIALTSSSGLPLGTGLVQGGTTTIQFPAISSFDSILITATAYNKNTYTGYVYISGGVGIEESLLTRSSIFPNPVQSGNPLTIQNSDPLQQIRILSIEGKLLQAIPVSGEKTEVVLPLQEIAAGIYLLEVITLNSREISRLIVE